MTAWQLYDEGLRDLPEIIRPHVAPHVQHAWHLYVIQLDLDRLTIDRNEFMKRLQHAQVGCSVHFIPLHLHPYYRDTLWLPSDDFPTANAVIDVSCHYPCTPDDGGGHRACHYCGQGHYPRESAMIKRGCDVAITVLALLGGWPLWVVGGAHQA